MVRQKQPYGIFLMETKVNRLKMEHVCKSLNFQKFVIGEAIGLAGGIMLMWNEEIDFECVW